MTWAARPPRRYRDPTTRPVERRGSAAAEDPGFRDWHDVYREELRRGPAPRPDPAPRERGEAA